MDVEATTAIRQAEVLAAKRMVERVLEGFDLYPANLIGDTAYGTAEMLNWPVDEYGIEPHIPVFDKSQHTDGTFSRNDFASPMTTSSTAKSALPGRNSGGGKKSIDCRARSSIGTA